MDYLIQSTRSSIIDANTQLLDDAGPHIPPELFPIVDEAKAQLAQEIAREREWETRHDQVRDERFE